ncbi:penicillin-binding protein activator [Halopseudomonas pelagia]|uniref:penicillin-binding protein activator n=1 Tax=Halopseudomonas pelagia TaxID=553151 RepID=UPI0030DAEA18|tara:strand:- start:6077 stop:8041 length:1965 start_codon:yes stop_codon:yes gene_type:complete
MTVPELVDAAIVQDVMQCMAIAAPLGYNDRFESHGARTPASPAQGYRRMFRSKRLPFLPLTLAVLIAGCSSAPQQLGDLPRTPQASAEKLLEDADRRSGAEANLLRLYAAQAASDAGAHEQTLSILERIPQSDLPTDQQIRFSQLQAISAMALNEPKMALRALRHPSISQIDSLPLDEQLRIQQLQAEANDQVGEYLKAAQQRIFIHSLLPVEEQAANQQAIWQGISKMPLANLQAAAATSTGELAAWLELALIDQELSNLDLQVRALKQWQEDNPSHPAALELPGSLSQLVELHSSRPQHIALLLPFQGQLANAGQALRDGFLAAQYQAYSQGLDQPEVSLYDSTAYTDLDAFYRQAIADGVEWVIGPLEREQVSRLAAMPELPLPTLALNYTESATPEGKALFQFGLAPEDEARSAATQAWAQGHRRMAALTARTEWGERAYQAFQQAWQEMGGVLVAREVVDEPAAMAGQIGEMLRIRQSEQRGRQLQRVLGSSVVVQPTPRQDLDALFITAGPLQARQIMPTLAFQYAADLPVYATSHVYQVGNEQNNDLDGILVAETPWLLTRSDSLYDSVTQNWPQAGGALGRLYAMGIDAQRIFTRLGQMQQYPETTVNGATGILSLSSDGRIRRELSWGVIQEGRLAESPALLPAP